VVVKVASNAMVIIEEAVAGVTIGGVAATVVVLVTSVMVVGETIR